MKLLRATAITSSLMIVLVIGLRLVGFSVQKYADEAVSMQPTVSPGDICLSLMNHSWASGDIKEGMIVHLRHINYDHLLTKRIIATEGETVHVSGDKTYVNGELLPEPYMHYSDSSVDLVTTDSIVVGKGKLFVMGDNRGNSMDSRYPEFGLVDLQDVVGRPLVVVWSEDGAKFLKLLF